MGKKAIARIKYKYEPNIQLNEEQQKAKELIDQNSITLIFGKAGSGKTLLAVEAALSLLSKRDDLYNRIVIAKPYIQEEEYGLLPGTLDEKLDPNYAYIKDIFNQLIGREKTDQLIKDGIIYFLPLGFSRGITLKNCVIISDESQSWTFTQALMLLTRFGNGSKMIITADIDQIFIPKAKSCVDFLKALINIEDIGFIEFFTNNRHPLVAKIIDKYKEKYQNKGS